MKKIPFIFSLLLMGLVGESFADAPKPRVRLITSKGVIVIELDRQAAPKTVENFLMYVDSGFYAGTIFHRVIKGFMIQGGGLLEDMNMKSTKSPIPNEADNGLKNVRGSIAMARTQDPNSATSQFFINTVDNEFLNHKGKTAQGWGYCVFGRVVEGLEVVDTIEGMPTTSRAGFRDVPGEPVVIISATAENAPE